MTDVGTLLDAIREAPDDLSLRLRFADALERAGASDRASFIRAECGAPTTSHGPRATDAAARQARANALAGPIAEYAMESVFDRGLVTAATAGFATWVDHGADMFRAAPIRAIHIADEDDVDLDVEAIASELAACAWLAHVRSIAIATCGSFNDPDVLAILLASPHLHGLEQLTVGHPLAAIAAARSRLPRLCGLFVHCEGAAEGDAALAALAGSELPLTTLELVGCGVTADGIAALAASRFVLGHLVLAGTHYTSDSYGEPGVRTLVSSPVAAKLAYAVFEDGGLDDEAMRVLAASQLRELTHLGLANNSEISDAGAAALANSPLLRTVVSIDLAETGVTETGAAAMSQVTVQLSR